MELITNIDIKVAFLIFLAYILIDGLYAKYTLYVTEKSEFKAATSGMIIHFLLAFGVINYTQNWLYIFPLALGSWIGTFIVIKRFK
ncbi:MAG: hypothetical protein KAT32_03785 [Candidatus Moranbacteria bacterium]|nr:hypothetical protein [Candidatus Moranbacteria bacterium]